MQREKTIKQKEDTIILNVDALTRFESSKTVFAEISGPHACRGVAYKAQSRNAACRKRREYGRERVNKSLNACEQSRSGDKSGPPLGSPNCGSNQSGCHLVPGSAQTRNTFSSSPIPRPPLCGKRFGTTKESLNEFSWWEEKVLCRPFLL